MATPGLSPLGPAATDLGLGDMLGRQVSDETEEERKRRLLMQQQQSPAAASLLGPNYGLTGIAGGR